MADYTPCNYCGNPASTVVDAATLCCACVRCAQYFNTCTMCIHARECDFETNPSPLPKQVQQTTQQGPMVVQQIIKNPARIDISCRNGCPCFSEELGCLKENGICSQYTEVIPNVKM